MRKENGKVAATVRLGKTARKAPRPAGQLPSEQTTKKLSLPCMINGHEPVAKKPHFQNSPCRWCGRMMYWIRQDDGKLEGNFSGLTWSLKYQ